MAASLNYLIGINFLLISSCSGAIFSNMGNRHFLGSPLSDYKGNLPPDMWFEQNLDHFNDADRRTWQQRYFVNTTFYKSGGPVFLMIGGEGTADPIWMVEGEWIQYAQKYHALCVQLEHRFYGKSHPTPDISVKSLSYLSSEQALADLAAFRTGFGKKFQVSSNKWIAFGGSYPGSLAAWLRMKFPHLIHASVASSAPMLAKLNFKEYMGVVRDSLATTGQACNAAITEATSAIEQLMITKTGRDNLKSIFNFCEDIDVGDKLSVSNMYASLAGNFDGVVQYNKDNRKFEGAAGTNITIDTLCSIMSDVKIGDPIHRYASVNKLFLPSKQCLDFNYKKMIKEMRQTDWASSASEGGRQWTYQTCTEFGFFQSSDLQKQPFGQHFPLNFSVQQCTDIFGPKFNESLIQAGIDRTNTNYGGYGIKVSRILFPNGSIDPWHALGVTRDLSPDAKAIYIQGTAHCANMYPSIPSDPPSLVKAREQIRTTIGQWLNE